MIKCIGGPLDGQFIESERNEFYVTPDVRNPCGEQIRYRKYKFLGDQRTFFLYSNLPIDEAMARIFENIG